MVTEKCTRCL